MLATSTASTSAGIIAQLLTVRARSPGQQPTTLSCWTTQREQPVSSLTDGTSAPTRIWPSRVSAMTTDCLPDRRVLQKFSRSQQRPSLITPPRLKIPAHSDPVKRWNCYKAGWNRFCLLTGESVERLILRTQQTLRRHIRNYARAYICC